MGLGMAGNYMRSGITHKNNRMTSTDTSMPDYVPVGSDGQLMDEPLVNNLAQDGEKHVANLKVPTNTPTAADTGSCEKEGRRSGHVSHKQCTRG